ncbi:MAG TPA: alpha/beta hydrolase [Nitrososphaera sp.]|nr:alpha/beta hydrolase [Nitrososphaera sp.]
MSARRDDKIIFVIFLFLTTTLIASFTLTAYSGFASTESNNTLMQPDGTQGMGTTTTNATSTNTTIILVHGGWADGSSWGKVIPILKNAGHRVIAVQLPLHNSADDIATVKRAIELAGGPVLLVGHSYGGFVITNAGSNNPNVTGLVYVAAFAPDEGQSLGTFVNPAMLPPGILIVDSAGLTYLNPDMFHDAFAQDVNTTEADIMAIAQKPFNQSIFAEPSGPPAWKQLKTWYQVSDSDRMIPPDTQRMFAQRMNATTITIDTSHSSYVAHPDEIAQLILNATQGSMG